MVLEVLVYLTFGQMMVSQRFQEVPRAGSGRMLGGRRKKKEKGGGAKGRGREKKTKKKKNSESLKIGSVFGPSFNTAQ